jgi:hypothetical protein
MKKVIYLHKIGIYSIKGNNASSLTVVIANFKKRMISVEKFILLLAFQLQQHVDCQRPVIMRRLLVIAENQSANKKTGD